jgi:curved DNA-binding protein CbpA
VPQPEREGTRDAYKVLQVDPEADPDVIQAAYRRLAQKFHPDLVGDPDTPAGRAAADRMVAINVAWEILRDPSRRAAYDQERAGRGAPNPPATRPAAATPAPPSPRPAHSGTGPGGLDRLSFGRYSGWLLDDVLRADPGYLEWLGRTPAGRPYKAEIESLLRRAGRPPTGTTRGLPRR